MAVEVAVLELDEGALRRLGREADLPLTRLVRIVLDLPLRTDRPAEHDACRRLVGEHAPPAALAAVDATVEEVATDAGLEHRLGDLDVEHVVLCRLEAAELLGEDPECAFDRRVDDDRRAYGRLSCSGAHSTSFVVCSTTAL